MGRTVKRGLVIIAALFLISALALSYFDRGVEPGPIEIVEDMRARACRGEVEGFNDYIDKEAVEKELKRDELQRLRKEYVYSSSREPDGSVKVKERVINELPELLLLKWELFNDQVRAGKFGPICNMEIVRVGEGEGSVKLKFPGGERSLWRFGKVGEDWKLVSIEDTVPLTLSSLKSEMGMRDRDKTSEGHPLSDSTEQLALKLDTEDSATAIEGTDKLATLKSGAPVRKEIPVRNDTKQVSTERYPDERKDVLEGADGAANLAVKPSGHNFRNTRWGMTPDQVKAAEGKEPQNKSPGELLFDTYFKGERVGVRYKFSGNALRSGGVIFQNKHPQEIFYVQDYAKRRADLTTQYGEPVLDEEIWYNRLYEGVSERMGFAVSIGHLKLRSKWRTKSTDILLELKGEDYDMTLVLSYHSR